MTITLNGEAKELPGSEMPLPELLEHLGLGGKPVVIELDREALPPGDHAKRQVTDGSVIEIVMIAAGG
ncbi:sulfur carrier protein [Haloferula luteola]|uniref:Sulfur carrier protein n=1 Tax=Haloferula luteola TaxID=595692 RepID=A0A840V6W3_9BACT|nr:sulfur carrier protein ThiS [Haloferula luteola]MBB5353712.1 sulfur carrier protein [Haloferula luteola]